MKRFTIEDHGMKVHTSSGGWVRQENLEDSNRRAQEAAERERQRQRERVAAMPKTKCPFSTAMNPACQTNCALFCAGECAIHRLGAKAATEATEGHAGVKCPFRPGRTCDKACALYTGVACSIAALANNL